MVSFNFLLTKEDYFNFYYHASWLGPGKKITVIKTQVKNFLIFTGLMLLIKLSEPVKTFDIFFFFCVFMLASIFLIPILMIKTNSRKQAAAFTENPLNEGLFSKTEVIISEAGIFSKDKFTEVKYSWDCIVKKEETHEYFYLYINAVQAIIIPKRVLKTAVEKENLSKLLSKHISFDAEVGYLVKN